MHAKFAVMTNEKYHLAIRTSMNLNENRRIENFEISDDKLLADYLTSIIDGFFEKPMDKISSRQGARDALQNKESAKFKPKDNRAWESAKVKW